jgi:excisionase family DNA binding protein
MTDDSASGLTVREVATMSGLHVQTVRKYIRDGELSAHKIQGPHGPEWRVSTEDAEALAREQEAEPAQGEPDLSRTHSILTELMARITDMHDAQKALLPAPQEAEQRAERERRIEEALAGNADRIRELAEELGEVRAERDTLREDLESTQAERDSAREELAEARERIEQLEAELEAEREKGWWEKLRGR